MIGNNIITRKVSILFLPFFFFFSQVWATAPLNLEKLPPARSEFANYCTVTLGDMHGNVKKIIWSLLRAGVITMSADDYEELVALYNNWLPELSFKIIFSYPNMRVHEPLLKKSSEESAQELEKEKIISNIRKFKALLAKIKIVKPYKVRFLGDLLADRGKCDYLTLLLIEYLQQFLSIVIIESNHDYMLQKNVFSNSLGELYHLHYPNQNASMYGLKALFDLKIIDLQEIKRLMNLYNQHIKLIDYEFNSTNDELVVFMHAPNDLLHVTHLSECLDHWMLKHVTDPAERLLLKATAYHDDIYSNKKELMRVIDAINQQFSVLFLKRRVSLPTAAVEFLNNRDYPNLRKTTQKTINLLVHGHIGAMTHNYLCRNLDNDLGKTKEPDMNEVLGSELDYSPQIEFISIDPDLPMLFTKPVLEFEQAITELTLGQEILQSNRLVLLPNSLSADWFV